MTHFLTETKTIKIGLNIPSFRKWDIIKSGGSECIVIRISGYGAGQTTFTCYPHKRHSKKWKHWLWIKWLRLKVWIGDLYKN